MKIPPKQIVQPLYEKAAIRDCAKSAHLIGVLVLGSVVLSAGLPGQAANKTWTLSATSVGRAAGAKTYTSTPDDTSADDRTNFVLFTINYPPAFTFKRKPDPKTYVDLDEREGPSISFMPFPDTSETQVKQILPTLVKSMIDKFGSRNGEVPSKVEPVTVGMARGFQQAVAVEPKPGIEMYFHFIILPSRTNHQKNSLAILLVDPHREMSPDVKKVLNSFRFGRR